jgi:hypothetical protein
MSRVNCSVGDRVSWLGVNALIVEAYGYPVHTVTLRWTTSGVAGASDEVSGHKRNVPVSQLQPLPANEP